MCNGIMQTCIKLMLYIGHTAGSLIYCIRLKNNSHIIVCWDKIYTHLYTCYTHNYLPRKTTKNLRNEGQDWYVLRNDAEFTFSPFLFFPPFHCIENESNIV